MPATMIPVGPLKNYTHGLAELSVEPGSTVRQTLKDAHIPPELVALVMVNGEQQNKDYVVAEGDVVKVIAVLGGG
jgi:sulfur carrier protein ThiS